MYCENCGKELAENDMYCPVCGAYVTRPEQPFQPAQPVQSAPDIQIKNRKKRKLIVVLVCLCLAIGAAAACMVFLLLGRTQEKTIEKFETAMNANDKEAMLTLMFPKEQKDVGRQLFRDGDLDLISWSSDLREASGPVTLKRRETQAVEEADSALCEDVEKLLLIDAGVSYKKMEIVSLDVTGDKESEDSLAQVLMYQVGKNWYILPGCIQFVEKDRQASDIRQAGEIQAEIEDCLADSQVWEDMQMYVDIPISVEEDIEYLPQSFQNAYQNNTESSRTLRYTKYGAQGYAFSFDVYGSVKVYISSETSMDEWQVVPQIEEAYYTGETKEVEATNSTYSFIKMISEKSPFLGYWQADNAGIYIGYNASGGNEGMAIYYAFGGTDYGIITPVDQWDCEGENGQLRYQKQTDSEITYEFTIKDEDKITVVCPDGQTYDFNKGQITDDIRKTFVGDWVCDGKSVMGQMGEERHLILCKTCGYVHGDVDNVDMTTEYHDARVVELYNGEALHYFVLREGLVVDLGGTRPTLVWTGDQYKMDEDNRLWYDTYIRESGGEEYSYVKDGTPEAEEMKQLGPVLRAYQEFMNKQGSTYLCRLVYINSDNIPELYFWDQNLMGNGVVAYNQNTGELVEESSGYAMEYRYREKEGILFEYFGMHMSAPRGYYQLAEDGSAFTGISSANAFYIDGHYQECEIDDQSVDEQTFIDYDKKYGELKSCYSDTMYSSVMEAYLSSND